MCTLKQTYNPQDDCEEVDILSVQFRAACLYLNIFWALYLLINLWPKFMSMNKEEASEEAMLSKTTM